MSDGIWCQPTLIAPLKTVLKSVLASSSQEANAGLSAQCLLSWMFVTVPASWSSSMVGFRTLHCFLRNAAMSPRFQVVNDLKTLIREADWISRPFEERGRSLSVRSSASRLSIVFSRRVSMQMAMTFFACWILFSALQSQDGIHWLPSSSVSNFSTAGNVIFSSRRVSKFPMYFLPVRGHVTFGPSSSYRDVIVGFREEWLVHMLWYPVLPESQCCNRAYFN